MDAFLRRYATPLSLVTGLAISLTGIMMFFGVRGGISEIHEWIGWAFVAALLMHVARNWRAVLGMLKPRSSKLIVGGVGVVLAVLIVSQIPNGGGGGHQGGPWLVVNKIGDAPITAAAPALGMTSEQAIAKLLAKGITVESPQQSLAEIARKEDTEMPRLLALLLQD